MSEITRLQSLGADTERIAAFRKAAEVHIALCNASAFAEGVIRADSSPDTTDTKNR